MRNLVITLLFCATFAYTAFSGEIRPMEPQLAERYAQAIYRVEGGEKTQFPYGIRSIHTKSVEDAHRICLNTVNNNWIRWGKAGCHGLYVDFLADRYCPVSADPVGNGRWKKNMRAILKSDVR